MCIFDPEVVDMVDELEEAIFSLEQLPERGAIRQPSNF